MSDRPKQANRPRPEALSEPVHAGMENVAAAILAVLPKKTWHCPREQ